MIPVLTLSSRKKADGFFHSAGHSLRATVFPIDAGYFFFNSIGPPWQERSRSHSTPHVELVQAFVTVSSTVQSLLLQTSTSPSLTFMLTPPDEKWFW
jgi:hypothetical protein